MSRRLRLTLLSLVVLATLAAAAAFFVEPKQHAALPSPKCETERLSNMVGQTIMVGFPGDDENDEGVKLVRALLDQGKIGGVVLFPNNIRSHAQLKNLTAALRNTRGPMPPFIAVDQEGGTVQRLRPWKGFKRFPSAASVGQDQNPAAHEIAKNLYAEMAEELADVGFNMNLGPVVDLNTNPDNPIIGARKRSFGSDPGTVTSLAAAFIDAHRAANIVTVAKHFPGHGSSTADSHKRLPDISRSWNDAELEPYRRLSRQGRLDAVMVGHLYHPSFSDLEGVPASLSAKAIRTLRDEASVNFDGVVVSDDMEMEAVRPNDNPEALAVRAIQSGTDIVIFSSFERPDAALGGRLHRVLMHAVCEGRISRPRIEEAFSRVTRLKQRLKAGELAKAW